MQPKPHRRRWLQYGIRTLLVLMLAVGLFLTWLRHQRQVGVYSAQRQALEQLSKLGGHYKTESRLPAWKAWLVGKDYVTVTEVKFHGVKLGSGLVDYVKVKPADLECLQRIPTLKRLFLGETLGIDDSVLEYLQHATELEELNLDHATMTDSGMSNLMNLRSLKSLSLLRTQVSPRAAACLSSLPNLEKLGVSGSGQSTGQVTFCDFPKLRELHVGQMSMLGGNDYMEAENIIVRDIPNLEMLQFGMGMKSTQLRSLPSLRQYIGGICGSEVILEDLPALEELVCLGQHTSVAMRSVGSIKRLVASDCRFLDATRESFEAVEFLKLYGCELNGAEHRNWPRLQELGIGQLAPAEAVQCILAAPKLRTVYVQSQREIIADLRNCQCLDDLSLQSMPLTGDDLALVASLPKLRSLSLLYIDTLTGDELAHLKNCRQLTKLQFHYLPKLSDAAVPHLLALPETVNVELIGHFLSLSQSAREKLRARPNIGIQE